MKVNRFKRMRPRPLDGIAFSDKDRLAASATARDGFATVSFDDLRLLESALEREADYLEYTAIPLSVHRSEQETHLAHRLTRTRVLLYTLNMAAMRADS